MRIQIEEVWITTVADPEFPVGGMDLVGRTLPPEAVMF